MNPVNDDNVDSLKEVTDISEALVAYAKEKFPDANEMRLALAFEFAKTEMIEQIENPQNESTRLQKQIKETASALVNFLIETADAELEKATSNQVVN